MTHSLWAASCDKQGHMLDWVCTAPVCAELKMCLTGELWKGTVPQMETFHGKGSDVDSVGGWGLTWDHKLNKTVTKWTNSALISTFAVQYCTVDLSQQVSKGPNKVGPSARLKPEGGHVLSLWLWNCFPSDNMMCRHTFMSACIKRRWIKVTCVTNSDFTFPWSGNNTVFLHPNWLTKPAEHLCCVCFILHDANCGIAWNGLLEKHQNRCCQDQKLSLSRTVWVHWECAVLSECFPLFFSTSSLLPCLQADSHSLSRVCCPQLGSRSSCWWTAVSTPSRSLSLTGETHTHTQCVQKGQSVQTCFARVSG